jgi:hypothetical protein
VPAQFRLELQSVELIFVKQAVLSVEINHQVEREILPGDAVRAELRRVTEIDLPAFHLVGWTVVDFEQVVPAVGVILIQHQVIFAKGDFVHGHGIDSAEACVYQPAAGAFCKELTFAA